MSEYWGEPAYSNMSAAMGHQMECRAWMAQELIRLMCMMANMPDGGMGESWKGATNYMEPKLLVSRAFQLALEFYDECERRNWMSCRVLLKCGEFLRYRCESFSASSAGSDAGTAIGVDGLEWPRAWATSFWSMMPKRLKSC